MEQVWELGRYVSRDGWEVAISREVLESVGKWKAGSLCVKTELRIANLGWQ